MGKLRLCPQAVCKLFQQAVQIGPCITGSCQKSLIGRAGQEPLQMVGPVHIDDDRACFRALQEDLDGKAKGGQSFIPLAGFPVGDLR